MTPAPPGPYTDPNITFRGPYTQSITNPLHQAPSGQQATTVYDVLGTNHNPGNQGAVPPAYAPLAWAPGRDYYKNGGMVKQPFFNHVGGLMLPPTQLLAPAAGEEELVETEAVEEADEADEADESTTQPRGRRKRRGGR